MPQFARPTADALVGDYTTQAGGTSNLYQTIDEAAASDSDYIQSPTTPSADVYVCDLETISDPGTSSGYIIRVRAAKSAIGGGTITMTTQVREEYVNESSLGTLIEEFEDELTSSFVTYENALTTPTVTEFDDLQVRIVMTEA